MKTYKITVEWSMFGTYTVEAEDEAEALEFASEAALPEGDYAEGSFRVMDIEEEN